MARNGSIKKSNSGKLKNSSTSPMSTSKPAPVDTSPVASSQSDVSVDAFLPGLSPNASTHSVTSDPSSALFGKVMCLVSASENGTLGKLSVNPDAVSFLSTLKSPIAVVAVAGLSRTGKSFMLNQLAGLSTGFEIGASIQPKTQGLWMCALDSATMQARGLPSTMTTVLIDTEGIGSFTRTETYDAKIFALAVVLSSMLIYNTMGSIDEGAIQSLCLAASLARTLRCSSVSASPALLWLLRDFALQLTMADNKPLTPDAFLEHVLASSCTEESLSNSRIASTIVNQHADIRSLFPARSCMVLPRPVNDEEDLARLDQLPNEGLREEYRTKVSELLSHVHSNLVAKTVDGAALSGELLCNLLNSYVDDVNSDRVPELTSTWAIMIEEQIKAARAEAICAYEHKMARNAATESLSFEGLLVAYTDALGSAETTFLRGLPARAVDCEVQARSLAQIRQAAKQHATRMHLPRLATLYKQENEALAASLFGEAVFAPEAADSFETLRKLLDNAVESYELKGLGSATKYEAFFRFAVAQKVLTRAEALSGLAVALAEDNSRQIATRGIDSAKNDYDIIQDLYKCADNEWKREQESSKSLRETNATLYSKISELEGQLKKANTSIDGLEAANAASVAKALGLEQKTSNLAVQMEETKARMIAAEGTISSSEAAVEHAKQDLEKQRQVASSAASISASEIVAARAEVQAHQSRAEKLAARVAELEASKHKLHVLESELAGLGEREKGALKHAQDIAAERDAARADAVARINEETTRAESNGARLVAAQASLEELKRQAESAKTAHETEMALLRDESRRTQEASAAKHASDLESIAAELKKAKMEHEKATVELQAQIESLQQQVAQAQANAATCKCTIM